MTRPYTRILAADKMSKEAKRQAILDMAEFNAEFLKRIPEGETNQSRFTFPNRACVLSPNFIAKALKNNVTILLPI